MYLTASTWERGVSVLLFFEKISYFLKITPLRAFLTENFGDLILGFI